jgi:proteasome lid subunit RPN8/RPN11
MASGQEDDDVIELTEDLTAELIGRARAEAPQEACGLIGVGRGEITLYRAENAAERPQESFVIAPKEQLRLIRSIEDVGQELRGIYHSHPQGPAVPSPRDKEIAKSWPGLTWVIVGLGGVSECPYCEGGVITDVEPECCGNTTSSGECRGDCAVPRQVEKPCPSCGGAGEHGTPAVFAGLL